MSCRSAMGLLALLVLVGAACAVVVPPGSARVPRWLIASRHIPWDQLDISPETQQCLASALNSCVDLDESACATCVEENRDASGDMLDNMSPGSGGCLETCCTEVEEFADCVQGVIGSDQCSDDARVEIENSEIYQRMIERADNACGPLECAQSIPEHCADEGLALKSLVESGLCDTCLPNSAQVVERRGRPPRGEPVECDPACCDAAGSLLMCVSGLDECSMERIHQVERIGHFLDGFHRACPGLDNDERPEFTSGASFGSNEEEGRPGGPGRPESTDSAGFDSDEEEGRPGGPGRPESSEGADSDSDDEGPESSQGTESVSDDEDTRPGDPGRPDGSDSRPPRNESSETPESTEGNDDSSDGGVVVGNLDGGTVPGDTNSSSCFPADALTRLEDGRFKRMDELEVGDVVQVGKHAYSPIFMFGHKDAGSLDQEFLGIELESGARIEMSRGHVIRRGGTSNVAAQQIRVGDMLEDARTGMSRVVRVDVVTKSGLFAPHTLEGDIVVGNVVASCYTSMVSLRLAHMLLLPERLAFQFGLTVFGGMLEKQTPTLLAHVAHAGGVSVLN